MYRLNVANQIASASVPKQQSSNSSYANVTITTAPAAVNSAQASITMLANIKTEPIHDGSTTTNQQQTASTSSATSNGHVIYAPMKRPRIDG